MRKRAVLACTHCHHHKVRCDAWSLGSPCTRCQEDSVTCTLRQRSIRRPSSAMTDVPGFQIIEQTSPTQIDRVSETTHGIDWTKVTHQGFVHYSQYSFLEVGDTSALDDADMGFLAAKGCLQVPASHLLEDFIKQFFLHVQPYTPLVDESIFWSIYEKKHNDGQSHRIPLLLFQAMLFASSSYVSMRTAEKCGFKDKRAAWSTLYKRAQLLYHSPLRVNSITRAQVALLLTFYTSPEEPQIANLWMAHAIHAATQVSPKPQERTQNSPRTLEASLYDRLWWSLLLRDRILCLGLRRHPQVLSFEMNMINGIPNEFEFEAEINGSRVYGPCPRRTLFIAFRDLCQLAVLLTEMLSLLYGHHGLSMPYLITDEFHRRLAQSNSIQTSLVLWSQSSETSTADNEKEHSSVAKFKHLKVIYYQAARVNLAHYQALLIEKHAELLDADYSFHISRAGNILSDAITAMIPTMEYFSRNGKIQDTPLSLLGYLAMPLVLSAINFKLSPTTHAMDDRRRIVESMGEIMVQSRRVYAVGDVISSGFDKILELAYYTSSKVFRKGWPQSPSTQNNQSSPASCLVNSPLRPGIKGLNSPIIQTTNWHDAFVRHTRGYLLISTTVDYFMSVGQMPQLGVPPEYLCFMSPLDMARVPCPAPPEGVEGSSDSEISGVPGLQSTKNPLHQPISEAGDHDQVMKSIGLGPTASRSTRAYPLGSEGGEYGPGYQSRKRFDLDFLSFEDSELTFLPLNRRPNTITRESGSKAVDISEGASKDGQDILDYVSVSADDFVSPAVYEFFGLMP